MLSCWRYANRKTNTCLKRNEQSKAQVLGRRFGRCWGGKLEPIMEVSLHLVEFCCSNAVMLDV